MVRSSWRAWVVAGVMVGVLPAASRAELIPRPLPQGFYLAESVRPLAEAMWQRSPSFRAQVDRIIDAGVLLVVQVVSPAELGAAAANASIIREGGVVKYVRIRLRVALDWTPLLPHELEHVLEALEGIDLRAEAKRGGHAWPVGRQGYESARAQEAGHRIAREFHRGDPARSARLLSEP